MAENNHDRFDPDYAASLNNYANDLSEAGHNEEALEHAKQALEISRRLAEKKPERFDPDYAGSLSNYAHFLLSKAGHNEEALEHAKQGLEIRRRLAENNHERFDPDYAASLDNYANHLGRVGRNKEALEHAKQALEIRRRLAENNHERFDPDYAASLNNYANHLGEAGRNEEALENAKQALEIYEGLIRKKSARFAKEQFSTTCLTHFLSWLANAPTISELPAIPKIIQPQQRPLLQLFATFVQACSSTHAASRAETFKEIILFWDELPLSNKTSATEYWLCATAWCATHESAAVIDLDWQADWHTFRSQRQGNVPTWMLEVALRLDFKWPE